MVRTKQLHQKPNSAGANLSGKFLESALKSTGKHLEAWYTILDNFGGANYEHNVLVSHLIEAYKMSQWEADTIVYYYHAARNKKSDKPHRHHRQRHRSKQAEKK